jgi:hypothetical protein
VDHNSAAAGCGENGCRQITRSGKVPFEDCIVDQTHGAQVRDREFAWLDITGKPAPAKARGASPVLAPGAAVEKLWGGFYNISGGAVDASGQLYFVDAHKQLIYRWSPEKKDLAVVRDNPLDPVNLAFDKAGDLLVVSSGGKGLTVYCFRPDGPEDQVTILAPERTTQRPGAAAILPVNYYVNGDFSNTLSTRTYDYPTSTSLRMAAFSFRPTTLSFRGHPTSDISSVLSCRRSAW